MAVHLEVPAQYGDVQECLHAAHGNLEKVKELLSRPSVEASESSAAILREVEVQLGCVTAVWKASGAKPAAEVRSTVQAIQREVAILAEMFTQTDKLFTGWLRAIQTNRAGYTDQGQAAPLMLVKQVNLEG